MKLLNQGVGRVNFLGGLPQNTDNNFLRPLFPQLQPVEHFSTMITPSHYTFIRPASNMSKIVEPLYSIVLLYSGNLYMHRSVENW